ncbi:hypothetical protein IM876_02615 [Serratia plymuthica]|uniref:hypothetical protein n=2 Tax=Serratia TaxID=613 RepID=UPI0019251E77|nr:hypothetical protein [Serratia plymuthica]MBL3521543.1 hypothetical protein [Serratia plymuthica]
MQQVQLSGHPTLHVNFSLHGKKNMAETKINTLADVAALRRPPNKFGLFHVGTS